MNMHSIEFGENSPSQNILPKISIRFILFFTLLCMSHFVIGQGNGRPDVRFTINQVDCVNKTVFVDIEIRAESSANFFHLAEQNYRLSFNRKALANPYIESELEISGFIFQNGEAILYSPHTLTGSSDTVISYNVELSGGPGYALSDVDYVKVGRLGFDVLDFDADMRIHYHTKDPLDFPPTIIIGKANNQLYNTTEGSYGNYYQYLGVACGNAAPSANDDNATTLFGTPVTIDILANDVDPESALDPASVTLVNTPPAGQGAVTVNPTTGALTFTPAPGFFGPVSPFQYQVCDRGVDFPAAHGDLNTDPVPMPDPNDPPMSSGTALCNTALVTIEVQTGSGPQSLNLTVFLEGPHDGSGGMATNLSSFNLVPLAQPYNTSPWNYNGTESTNSIPSNIVDWVMITVRTSSSNATVVDTLAALVRNDGQIVNSEGGALSLAPDLLASSLYIAVYHRNHLGIMSAQPVTEVGGVYTYDFTDSAAKVFGGANGVNQIEPGIFGMISGDFNANGQVQNTDYNQMLAEIGLSGYSSADFDMNSQTQNSDLQDQLGPNLGRGASFPY